MNKKGQSTGLVTGIVTGIAGLVILVIIAFTITSTLNSSNLLGATNIAKTFTNESDNDGAVAWLNATNYTFRNENTSTDTFTVTAVWASVDTNYPYNVSLPAGYYTVYSTGQIAAANATVFSNVSYSGTFVQDSQEQAATDRILGNYTTGIDNVSSKVPTVLLIAAIVLILTILGVLVVVWRRMSLGGEGGSI